MANRRIIDVAQGALRDLHGLVPIDQRKWADDPLRTLEQVISAYGDAIERLNQIETALHFGDRGIETALANIERA